MAVNTKIAPVLARKSETASRGGAAKTGPLRVEDMVNLYRSIIRALPDHTGRVVEIIAANRGEGVSTVTRALAEAAAAIGNARVLICDATPETDNFKYYGMPVTRATLNDAVSGSVDLRQVIDPVPAHGFAICAVNDPGGGAHVAVNLDVLDPVFAQLRSQFDLILIDAPATARGILGPALAKKADGVVMVVQAERTRAPVVTEAQRMIEINGGQILGVVLNKRRFHIPRWIYRWL